MKYQPKNESPNQGADHTPTISLPKGGGAIRGMGEKFAANPVTGTGSLSIPLALSPGRAGFTPQLALSYDSGGGNTPFGLGWNIGLPSITRKTQKGLPQYEDNRESDVFILSGAEDLVPVLNDPLPIETKDYMIKRYCPRIEGLFARIEKWTSKKDSTTFWKSISRENITTIYGQSAQTQIADPENPAKIFDWLIEKSFDDKGNIVQYEYKPEDGINIRPEFSLCEKNRRGYAQKYLKRVLYGNSIPYLKRDSKFNESQWEKQNVWLFEAILDYGEHIKAEILAPGEIPTYKEQNKWPSRYDPFSSFQAGFELRTYRLCQRVLMFHHFAELGVEPHLVRSTDLEHHQHPVGTQVKSITHFGYRETSGAYEKASMPPVSFKYTEAKFDSSIREPEPENIVNMPQGIDGARSRWMDLYGEGLSGILTETPSSWHFKRNLGNARFAPIALVGERPSLSNLSSGQQQLVDLGGDGMPNLVIQSDELNGYYEVDEAEKWGDFITFKSNPQVNWNDPNLRPVDIDGDGHPDLLISEHDCFLWYPSKEKEGYDPARKVAKALDEETGPKIVFNDGTQSIYLTDMSGDGLTDIVRIRNGEICYWANLGYGRFSRKIAMGGAPYFDNPDLFDQRRIRLADIDGTGTTDVIYLGRNTIQYWANQSGNNWTLAYELKHFPKTDNLTAVSVMDFLGNGTACFVWSSQLPEHAGNPVHYIDLMGQKPYLLCELNNNMGAITRMEYAPSTRFYVADRLAGKRWITRLPFPVHVLERVETYDAVTHNRFVGRYAYHHGYFDGVEREFRGFGMVEEWDVEDFASLEKNTLFSPDSYPLPSNWSEKTDVPPVYSRTWFHTGFFMRQDIISKQYEKEYYPGDFQAWLLDDTELPSGLTAEEEREACRALKGQMLRQEIYTLDNQPGKSEHPYTVTENKFHLRVIQPKDANRHAVFYTCPCESLAYHYERDPTDPRIMHQSTLETDEFGNVKKGVQIAYPRRKPRYPEQDKLLITYVETDYINKPNETDFYRISLPFEIKTYEITGISFQNRPLEKNFLITKIGQASEIPYEAKDKGNVVEKRLIERTRQTYFDEALNNPLPLGQIAFHALPHTAFTMIFTPGLIDAAYNQGTTRVTRQMLEQEGKYLFQDKLWWLRSDIQVFDKTHFYLPVKVTDWFDHEIRVEYDQYTLLQEKIIDVYQKASGTTPEIANIIEAKNDYRTLQPYLLIDPDGDRAEVAFDVLGMVVATAVSGRPGENLGDELSGFASLQSTASAGHLDAILADPLAALGHATTFFYYDLFAWMRNQTSATPKANAPVYAIGLSREFHFHDSGASSPVQIAISYSDGFGREVLTKVQAEDGDAPYYDGNAQLVLDSQGKPALQHSQNRWVGKGRTEFNNKGKPVKQYEPFFDNNPYFTSEKALVQFGVTPILHYDPLTRVIKTELSDGTLSRMEFTPWEQRTYDQNDTVLDPDCRWYKDRGSPPPKGPEPKDPAQRAAWLAAQHANTPQIQHLDILGRPFLSIEQNINDQGKVEGYETRIELDIEGNQLSVTDALNRVIATSVYHVHNEAIFTHSVDAGDRWMLHNIEGKDIHHWDSRGHHIETKYDIFQRPTHLWVRDNTGKRRLAERMIYAETQPGALVRQARLRGQLYLHLEGAGLAKNEQFDFKGNLLSGSRTLTTFYKTEPDWQSVAQLNDEPALRTALGSELSPETFSTGARYDALNRPLTITAPDGSQAENGYNKAGLLETVKALMPGKAVSEFFVKNIDYDAKGQRTRIQYGNGTTTTYTYDPKTFRLVRLLTTRFSGTSILQDLRYTYDPVGNITEITDNAQPAIFHNGQKIDPRSFYRYDALYRLMAAGGREHNGLKGQTTHADVPIVVNNAPNDAKAVRNYQQTYRYDPVGNIEQMKHVANGGSWTRNYDYLNPQSNAKDSNRLYATSNSQIPGGWHPYTYDAHGNMTTMPHLKTMHWNFRDELMETDTSPELMTVSEEPQKQTVHAYYAYDAGGQRVRKLAVYGNGVVKERLYLFGFYEVFRQFPSERAYSQKLVERERRSLHVMDDKQRISLVETLFIEGHSRRSPSQLAPVIRYQLGNHLGSAHLELDENAKVITYEEYHSYGTTAYRSGINQQEVERKRYRYTGMERDEETGLNYHGARYYAGWLGRWCSVDPAGYVDGVNLYEFVQSNPIKFIDSKGMQREQMHLIESNKTTTVALRHEVAYVKLLRQWVRRLAIAWGEDPKKYVLGHDKETPHYKAQGGSHVKVGPQTKSSNTDQSIHERRDAGEIQRRNERLRSSGQQGPPEFKRSRRVDPSAHRNMRHNLELPNDIRGMANSTEPPTPRSSRQSSPNSTTRRRFGNTGERGMIRGNLLLTLAGTALSVQFVLSGKNKVEKIERITEVATGAAISAATTSALGMRLAGIVGFFLMILSMPSDNIALNEQKEKEGLESEIKKHIEEGLKNGSIFKVIRQTKEGMKIELHEIKPCPQGLPTFSTCGSA